MIQFYLIFSPVSRSFRSHACTYIQTQAHTQSTSLVADGKPAPTFMQYKCLLPKARQPCTEILPHVTYEATSKDWSEDSRISVVSSGYTTVMAISRDLVIGETWTGVYGGFVSRLGTLLTQLVPGKSQAREHLCARAADKHILLAAAFN